MSNRQIVKIYVCIVIGLCILACGLWLLQGIKHSRYCGPRTDDFCFGIRGPDEFWVDVIEDGQYPRINTGSEK
jgi:hypothetical protein